MIRTIYECGTVEEAAKKCAGNYREWEHFMWFGESHCQKPENVMLTVIVDKRDPSVRQLANMEFLRQQLNQWWGMMDKDGSDPSKCVDDYGASVYGDNNAIGGFMIRVYDDQGGITPAFNKLYELVQSHYSEEGPMDEVTAKIVNEREIRKYVASFLIFDLKDKGVEYSEQLLESIVDTLVKEEEASYDYIQEEQYQNLMLKLAGVLDWDEDEDDV